MNNDINLLRNSSDNQDKKDALNKFKKYIIKISTIYVVIVLSFLGSYFYFSFSSRKINQDLKFMSEQIKQYSKVENLQVALKQRISAINRLLVNQGNEIFAIETIENLVGANNQITALIFNQKTIFASGDANDKQTLVDFSSRVENFAKQQSALTFGPVIWKTGGTYEWVLEVTLPDNQPK